MKRENSGYQTKKEPLKKKPTINSELEIEFKSKIAPHALQNFKGQLEIENG